MARRVWMALLALAVGAGVSIAAPAMAAPGDSDGLNLDAVPGPAVWIEELWDVKAGQLEQFLYNYNKEVYALARRTPGYRGYTVLTNIPAPRAEHPNQESADIERIRLSDSDTDNKLIGRHPSIRLQGRTLTERQINYDVIFRKAYNVRIIHHIRAWADADQFRARMARIYADEHPGEALADHLAKTVFPLANNYWTSTYRMIKSGWPGVPSPNPRAATDADGLNLEPRKGLGVVIYEHWDVKPDQFQAFLSVYENDVYSLIRKGSGYRGYAIATSLPPQPWEGPGAAVPQADVGRLGGDDANYVPSPGVMMDGAVRTDTSINVGALYKRTFNVIVVHEVKDWQSRWFYEVNDRYKATHNGDNMHKPWRDTIMPHSNNHWDSGYRIVMESYISDAAAKTDR